MFRGGQFSCPQCSSKGVKVYSRITGYYSEVNRYNLGKRVEWESRRRYNLFNKFFNGFRKSFCILLEWIKK